MTALEIQSCGSCRRLFQTLFACNQINALEAEEKLKDIGHIEICVFIQIYLVYIYKAQGIKLPRVVNSGIRATLMFIKSLSYANTIIYLLSMLLLCSSLDTSCPLALSFRSLTFNFSCKQEKEVQFLGRKQQCSFVSYLDNRGI